MGPDDAGDERLPAFGVTTLADAAGEVLAAARRGGLHGLHAFPFNRFHREDTTLYVEKGVGRAAVPAYRDTAKGWRYITDPTWLWDCLASALG